MRFAARAAFVVVAVACAIYVLQGNADRGRRGGIVALPMDDLAAAPMPPGIEGVSHDAPMRTYRVGRESRPARLVKAPARLSREITIPAGGARFETAIAPLKEAVVLTVAVNGGSPAAFAARPGLWTTVHVELPAGARTARLVETLEGPGDALVAWSDDHLVPNRPAPAAPDVIVVALDTVRYDYLSPYTPAERTTPSIADLAREGTRFDQAISVSSWTTPAMAALVTGVFPRKDIGFTERLEPEALTLAEIFAAAGYDAHGESGAPAIDAVFGFQQGYRSYIDSAEPKNAAAITDRALQRITEARGAPLFLFLNYFDAHELNTSVTGPEWSGWESGTLPLQGASLAHLRSAYRFDIAAIDRELGRLFHGIRRARDWDNTIVVVVADHGQMVGDRGLVGHGFSLDEELIRIPLIVKAPPSSGLLKTREYGEQFQMTDVFGLIVELAGLRRPDGPSYVERIAAGTPVRALTFSHYYQPPRPEVLAMRRWQSEHLQAVRTDRIKVVRDKEGRVTTFDIRPGPQTAVHRSELTDRLLGELDRFTPMHATASSAPPLSLPQDVLERLRALGYIR